MLVLGLDRTLQTVESTNQTGHLMPGDATHISPSPSQKPNFSPTWKQTPHSFIQTWVLGIAQPIPEPGLTLITACPHICCFLGQLQTPGTVYALVHFPLVIIFFLGLLCLGDLILPYFLFIPLQDIGD